MENQVIFPLISPVDSSISVPLKSSLNSDRKVGNITSTYQYNNNFLFYNQNYIIGNWEKRSGRDDILG